MNAVESDVDFKKNTYRTQFSLRNAKAIWIQSLRKERALPLNYNLIILCLYWFLIQNRVFCFNFDAAY